MQIITATTPNLPYIDEIPFWKESLEKFGYISYQIGILPDHGNWMKNCLEKSQYMWHIHQKSDEGILWLDIDCRLLGPMNWIEEQSEWYDFLCLERKECRLHKRGWWLNAGVMYFGKTPEAAALLEDWAARCKDADPDHWMAEQSLLADAYYATNPKPKFRSLPLSYNCDWDDPAAEEAVIIQEKASRKYKGIVDSGLPKSGEMGPITVEEAREMGTREFT